MLTLISLAIPLLLSPAQANSTGKTGKSTAGCTTCHGSATDSTTTSTLSASASTVGPSDTVTITFTVNTTNSSRTHAGLNVSANGGTFSAGTGTQVSSSEITHSSPMAMSSSTATFSFDWVAPATEGTYTLYGAGNAVNNNGASSGDGWDLATNLSITVVCADADTDGYTVCDGDCDDGDAAIHPGATEICDGVDNDCDGSTDVNASGADAWYQDADLDGYGDAFHSQVSCTQPSGYVADSTDCDDTRASVNPGAVEVCDVHDRDEDCNGYADDEDVGATGLVDWYYDDDLDGFGNTTVGGQACDAPDGGSLRNDDCADDDDTRYPGAPETCADTIDMNCDGSFGGDDEDGDGFAACTDCNDADPDVNPDATEVCNGKDDDCDGVTDPDDSSGAPTWYRDADFDGYGVSGETATACEQPHGWADNTDDCDDSTAGVHPDAVEVYYDGIDQNCDGNDDDWDEDGTPFPEDCDDQDPSRAADCSEPDTGPVVDTGGDDGADGADGGDGSTTDEKGCGSKSSAAFLLLAGLGGLALRRRREA